MLKFAPYVLKTLCRHRARTLLTLTGAAVGLFVFCFVGSVQQGLDNLFRQQEAGRSLIVFQAHKLCPATSRLPQDYAETVRGLPGVRDAVPIQVLTNNCRASLDVVVFYGLPPDKLLDVRDLTLLAGNVSEFQSHRDAALVGRSVARRRAIAPGDKFSLGDYTVSVAGVFASSDPADENYIYTHLEYLQRGRSQNLVGTVTQIEVLLEPGADPDQACQAIDDALRGGPVPTRTRPKGAFQAQTLEELAGLIGLGRYLGFACIGVVVMLLATTTVMAVQDRIREHAVLQTLGFSTLRVFGLVLSESVLLSTAGGAIGTGLAVGVLWWSDLAVGSDAITIAFAPSPQLALTGLVVAICARLVAGVFPAYQAATADVVPSLRQT